MFLFKKVTLCFSFQFLVLAFCLCFVCFLFQDVFLFLVFRLFSCFVLNRNIRYFALLLVFLLLLFFGFCCFGILLFLNFGYLSKTSLKNMEIPEPQNEKRRKRDILTRAVSTGVFTNGVFFFLCVFKFCMFCRKYYKIVVSANKNQKGNSKVKNWSKSKLKLVQVKVKHWFQYVAQQTWTNF